MAHYYAILGICMVPAPSPSLTMQIPKMAYMWVGDS